MLDVAVALHLRSRIGSPAQMQVMPEAPYPPSATATAILADPDPEIGEAASTFPDKLLDQTTLLLPLGAERTCQMEGPFLRGNKIYTLTSASHFIQAGCLP